ncbi:MAG: PorV/PorQ family protein [Ignavibacteriales bacterium]|nr:PorV/PorQ family protein [Ignavibacteriales bacterium]
MKQKAIFAAVLLCMAVMLLAVPALAQHQRVGAVAAPELLIPVGARDLALGGSSISTTKGVEAMYWNPAGLAHMDGGAEAMFSSMSYIADVNVVYGAVGGKFGSFGNVGFTIKSLSFGDIPLTTEDDPENVSGRFYSPTFVTVSAAYSRPLTDAITIGFGLKLISEKIDRVASSGFAFDFGVQYAGVVGVQGLNLGLAVKNVGPQMKFEGTGLYRQAIATGGNRPQEFYLLQAASFELPALVEIGLSYDYKLADNFNALVSGSFTNNNLYFDSYNGGLELAYSMEDVKLYGRGGYSAVPQNSDNEIYGATYGFGLGYNLGGINLVLDYGYRSAKYFSANQVFSVKLEF